LTHSLCVCYTNKMEETYDWLGPEPASYPFYGGSFKLFFDDKEHRYFRFVDDQLIYIPGVTTVVGIRDRSAPLMQWASNMACQFIAEQCSRYPGADTPNVLGWLGEARLKHKEFKEEAGDVGHIAHAWLEDYINDCITQTDGDHPLPENPQAKNGVCAAMEWMQKHAVRFVFTERKAYSRRFDYAGTGDGLAYISSCGDSECCGYWVKEESGRWEKVALEFTDVLAVVDWKTSKSLHDSYDWQVSGYLEAFNEEIEAGTFEYDVPKLDGWRVIVHLPKDGSPFGAKLLPPNTHNNDLGIFLDCLSLYNSTTRAEEQDKAQRREIRAQGREDREADRIAAAEISKDARDRKHREVVYRASRYKELRALKVPVVQARQQVEEDIAAWAA
jgi:hypothetical protein